MSVSFCGKIKNSTETRSSSQRSWIQPKKPKPKHNKGMDAETVEGLNVHQDSSKLKKEVDWLSRLLLFLLICRELFNIVKGLHKSPSDVNPTAVLEKILLLNASAQEEAEVDANKVWFEITS
jgi:hypothetical protein